MIARLINNSFQQTLSTFSDAWKLADVVPIPCKEGDPEIPANNWPISLVPIFSKVVQRLAQKQVFDFLTRNYKFSIHQSGNKKHNSTETALVTDPFLKAVDQTETVSKWLSVILDVSKAFDCLIHNCQTVYGMMVDELLNAQK